MSRTGSRYPTILFAVVVCVAMGQAAWWTYFQVRQSHRYLALALREADAEARVAAADLAREFALAIHSGTPVDAATARRWIADRHPRLAWIDGAGGGGYAVGGFEPPGRVVISPDTETALGAEAHGHVIMFLAEGSFFAALLLAGVFLMYRTFRLEQHLKRQETDFLAAASHDLRTPIATVQLLAETLAKGRIPAEKIGETYANLTDEVGRLSSMVDNLIEAGRIDQRRLSSAEVSDVSEQAAAVIDDMGAYLRKREVSVETEFGDDVVAALDAVSLRSITRNLIENAAKYSRPPRHLRVRTWRRNGVAFLEVTDNGIGIPESERERVFQRFYRTETELSRRERGVGLGLYLVRSFAEAGGGEVKALPADWGEGTTIRVQLHAAEGA